MSDDGAAGGIRALDFEISHLSALIQSNDPVVNRNFRLDYESRALTRLGHCGTYHVEAHASLVY